MIASENPPRACPSPERLSAFHLGRLAGADLDAVAAHLDVCERCAAALDVLSDDGDPLLAELRRPTPSPDLSDSERARAAVLAERAVGQLGQYELLEKLGEGGMGQVFKARHLLLNRVVALKVIHREYVGWPAALQRFQRAMRALARLNHPGIVAA
jgi:serine/threonine-protein kinase